MFSKTFASLLFLPATLRTCIAFPQTSGSTSTVACNNSPSLCSRKYNNVTYLGAHDSPFLRDQSTGFSISGDQSFDSTAQLSAGVRLLTAQVQTGTTDGQLHVCHTSCDLLDAGLLSDWLAEVRTWMTSNPNEIVTLLLVNGVSASASQLAAEYETAGITSNLTYTPTGTTSQTQDWPTLQSLIDNGTRLVNFISSLDDNTGAEFLMNQDGYVFQNSFSNTSPTDYSCVPDEPASVANNTAQAIASDLMPLMNHFLYQTADFLGTQIQSPNQSYVGTTNAASGGVGNLGSAATQCTQDYGRAPSFIVVDFFNEGPAIATVDRLNGVTNPVGRTSVTAKSAGPSSGAAKLLVSLPWVKYAVAIAACAIFV